MTEGFKIKKENGSTIVTKDGKYWDAFSGTIVDISLGKPNIKYQMAWNKDGEAKGIKYLIFDGYINAPFEIFIADEDKVNHLPYDKYISGSPLQVTIGVKEGKFSSFIFEDCTYMEIGLDEASFEKIYSNIKNAQSACLSIIMAGFTETTVDTLFKDKREFHSPVLINGSKPFVGQEATLSISSIDLSLKEAWFVKKRRLDALKDNADAHLESAGVKDNIVELLLSKSIEEITTIFKQIRSLFMITIIIAIAALVLK